MTPLVENHCFRHCLHARLRRGGGGISSGGGRRARQSSEFKSLSTRFLTIVVPHTFDSPRYRRGLPDIRGRAATRLNVKGFAQPSPADGRRVSYRTDQLIIADTRVFSPLPRRRRKTRLNAKLVLIGPFDRRVNLSRSCGAHRGALWRPPTICYVVFKMFRFG